VRVPALQSDILRFIVENGYHPGDPLPTIQEISEMLGVSVAKTRESLEIARALGVVDIKPGRGTRVEDFAFGPVVTLSALYAIGQDGVNFARLREVRDALEIQFWEEATGLLQPEDLVRLRGLLTAADHLLERQPVQVPAQEHRAFHMTIFSRLNNPFVQGMLEAFWEAYEAFGLNLYQDLSYHRTVWEYHARIVDAIEAGDVDRGRQLLIEHMNLLQNRQPLPEQVSDPIRDPRLNAFE
jgi:DNA-binding FadR family transcriptional regulator